MKTKYRIFLALILFGFGMTSMMAQQKTRAKLKVSQVQKNPEITINSAISEAQKSYQNLETTNALLETFIQESQTNPQPLLHKIAELEAQMDDVRTSMNSVYNKMKLLKGILPDSPVQEAYAGFGKNATGGENFSTVYVTNLNDSGPGSLRAALASGNRTIKFSVGGTINLNDNIKIEQPNVTIDGSSAPNQGITLRNYGLQIRSSNVIVEFIRIDVSNSPSTSTDALNITAYSGKSVSDVIINHVTLRGGRDGNLDIRTTGSGTVSNVSVLNSITDQNTKNVLLYGNVKRVSFIGNFMANSSERYIRSVTTNPDDFSFEMINNYLYNFRYATQVDLGTKFSVINNVYQSNRSASGKAIEGVTAANASKTHAYLSGNLLNGLERNNSNLTPYLKTSPFSSSGYVAQQAQDIVDMFTDVGCSLPNRDSKDIALIAEIMQESQTQQ